MAGSLLFKVGIDKLIENKGIIFSKDATISPKAATRKDVSVDFTIGGILIPGTSDSCPGGAKEPLIQATLKQGQTAVIRTAEKLSLPKGVSAICFPPSSGVSLPGLLTTNPGVIDPGFSGSLHLTVINMGKADFHLKKGMRILRVLFFQDGAITGPPDSEAADPVTSEVLEKLSHDFMNIEKRAEIAAKAAINQAELRIKWASIWGPLLGGALVAAISLVVSFNSTHSEIASSKEALDIKIQDIREKVSALSAKVEAGETVTALAQINERLKNLESNGSNRQPVK